MRGKTMTVTGKFLSKLTNHSGATVVEFAVLIPVFLLIIFGALEFGIVFYEKHFLANGVREGVRVGIRANNYECFNDTCSDETDRQTVTVTTVTDYLSTIWDADEIISVTVVADPDNLTSAQKELVVTAEVVNFMPEIISGLIPGLSSPDTIVHTSRAQYEDPSEP